MQRAITTINYVKGDATDPKGDGTKVIVHCCNDIGAFGAGFVLAISKKWRVVEESYKAWAKTKQEKNSTFRLGNYQLVETVPGNNILVCNLIGQEGIGRNGPRPPIRYEALREGMESLSITLPALPNVSVHMPRIGCGLAGGNWDEVESIIKETFCKNGVPVTVYDFL